MQHVDENSSKPDSQKEIQVQLMDQQNIDSATSSVRSITVHEIEENLGRQVTTEKATVKDSDIVIGAHVRLVRGKTWVTLFPFAFHLFSNFYI